MTEPTEPPDGGLSPLGLAIRRFFRHVGEGVLRYTRLDVEMAERIPEPPALVVANHGFGGIFDLNGFAIAGLTERFGIPEDIPFTILTHQLAWTIGVGRYLEEAGFRPASRESALDGLAAGQYVLVMPGGDIEASKPWPRRNEIIFGGRNGFAQLAIDAGTPIVPVVMVGAGESLLVLSDGQRLARALRLDRLLRLKAFPVTLSIPWGLNVGLVGVLPYVPLPTKMRAALLPAVHPEPGETAESLAARVHAAMSTKARELTDGRVPLLGWQRAVGGRRAKPLPG